MNREQLQRTCTPHERKFAIPAVFLMFTALGMVLGYSYGLNQEANALANYEGVTVERTTTLLEKSNTMYINPLEIVDLKTIPFPIEALRGCRNFAECKQLCSQPENFQSCVAWSKSQE